MEQDENAGGAQYILKNCTAEFWQKVENDCELLFTYLHNRQKHSTRIHEGLQIWCTDMWVIWWNAILQNRKFRIHPTLDFCWADSPSDELKKKKILHYTGSKRKDICIFEKTLFQTHSPFYSDLSGITPNTCSQLVVKTIKEYRKKLDEKRPSIAGVRLLLITPEINYSIEKAKALKCYYERYWNVDTILCARNEVNKLIGQCSNMANILIPYNRIIPIKEMNVLLKCLRMYENTSFLLKMRVWQMDSLGSHIFSKILDNEYLEENKGKTIRLSSLEDLPIIHGSAIEKELLENQIIDVYGL